MYEWFTFSMVFLGIWLVIYIANPKLRKEMSMIGLFTAPIGLTEPLFIGIDVAKDTFHITSRPAAINISLPISVLLPTTERII